MSVCVCLIGFSVGGRRGTRREVWSARSRCHGCRYNLPSPRVVGAVPAYGTLVTTLPQRCVARFLTVAAQRSSARARVGGAAADVRVRGSACLCGMAAITMADFLNGCSQFRTTLSHASHKVVREWDGEALKNAFGWADYIEQVTRAQRRAPVRLPAHTPRCAPHRR